MYGNVRYNWKFTLSNIKCWLAAVCKHSYIRNVTRNTYGEDCNRNQEVPVWTKTVMKSQPGWPRSSCQQHYSSQDKSIPS